MIMVTTAVDIHSMIPRYGYSCRSTAVCTLYSCFITMRMRGSIITVYTRRTPGNSMGNSLQEILQKKPYNQYMSVHNTHDSFFESPLQQISEYLVNTLYGIW